MAHHLYNTHNRPHQQYFGADAFYDLDLTNRQASDLRKLHPGDHCTVVWKEPDDKLRLETWVLRGFRTMDDPTKPGVQVRVLTGEHKGSVTLTRDEARSHRYHHVLFKKDGSLKTGIAVL